MNILIKVLLITIFSTLFVLLCFDYNSSQFELNLSSSTNCINTINNNHNYICNTCFKVISKHKTNQRIIVSSQQPFMLISINQQLSSILACQQWLQSISYQEVTQLNSQATPFIKLESNVFTFLNQLQNQHNQILLVQKPHLDQYSSSHYQYQSSLNTPYQILTYYTKNIQNKPFKIIQTNDQIITLSSHIISLLSIASTIAILYTFHITNKKSSLHKYNQHIFAVMGIIGTFLWVLFSNLTDSYQLYLLTCKVLFFSMTLQIIFGAGKWIFFGILVIIHALLWLWQTSLICTLILQLSVLLFITLRICSQSKSEYFHLQKNSNKKLYLFTMTLLIVGCSGVQYIQKNNAIGEISQFLVVYLCLISFLIGIKNLDGDSYQKLYEQQKKKLGKQISDDKFEGLPGTTIMFQENESIQQNELNVIKR